jgi:hypothetical protein
MSGLADKKSQILELCSRKPSRPRDVERHHTFRIGIRLVPYSLPWNSMVYLLGCDIRFSASHMHFIMFICLLSFLC